MFGLSSKHQLIHGLPDLDRFLSQGSHILDGFPRDWALSVRVFGVDDDNEVKERLRAILRSLNTLTEQLFVNEANSTAAIERCDIPGKAARLVTFSPTKEDLERWERSANVRVLQSDSRTLPGAVEVDMLHLVRDFGACISIPQLYGQDFLDRNETLLDDFWKFDNDLFTLMMIGIPSWAPIKVIKNGVAARSRVQKALEGLYKRADQYLKGDAVDFGANMSDISLVVRGRTKIYNDNNISMRHRGQLDLGNIWGQNANTQSMIFWFLLFAYSTPGLLDELRKEIAPHISLSDFKPSQITSFDLQAILRKCPLLKGAVYETFRMVDEPTSIRYVNQSTTVSDGQYNHKLKAGTWISAAHSIANKDPSIYAEPHKFIPDRFIETNQESRNKTARYGKMRPWGGGAGICKGRTFAEKEILAVGAAVISLWEILPVGEKWDIPPMRPGTGVAHPVRDIRVIIKRRVQA